MREVVAYQAYGIFGDYDGNAPDTATICCVATSELAKQLCAKLNENPRSYKVVYAEGWEWAKRFRFRPELVENKEDAHTTLESAISEFGKDESDDLS